MEQDLVILRSTDGRGSLAFTQMDIHDDHRLDDVTVRVEHEGLKAEARLDAYQIDQMFSLFESVASETKVWAGERSAEMASLRITCTCHITGQVIMLVRLSFPQYRDPEWSSTVVLRLGPADVETAAQELRALMKRD